jgi:hypothetical protein
MKSIHPLLKCLLLLIAFSNFAHAFYDPGQGRWVSRDPIQEAGGKNLYVFTENGGLNRWDLLGQKSKHATQPVYDPTPAGLTRGEVTDVIVATIDATVTYPDKECKGDAKLSFKINPLTLQMRSYPAATIQAIHEPGDDCSQNGASNPSNALQSNQNLSLSADLSSEVGISLNSCSGCICDTCSQGKIRLSLTGAAAMGTPEWYQGRYVTVIIYYKIQLKSNAPSLNYGKNCDYDHDGGLVKIEVYGPQNIGGR